MTNPDTPSLTDQLALIERIINAGGWLRLKDSAALRAIRRTLEERAAMTDTQADLTERARVSAWQLVAKVEDQVHLLPTDRAALTDLFAAALQSERDRGARDERNSWADQIRGLQKGKTELDLAGIKACAEAALIRPGHVIASAREVLAMIEQLERAQSESEAAAAAARPIVEAACRFCVLNGTKKAQAHQDLADAVQALFDRPHATRASPAPQGETQ